VTLAYVGMAAHVDVVVTLPGVPGRVVRKRAGCPLLGLACYVFKFDFFFSG
jgi:hypothetical protein